VLPGEAFCDECGASLSAAAPTVIPGASNDAPTMLAPPPGGAAAPVAGEQSVICAACGQPNLPTDRFCDHCGAALGASAAPADVAPALSADPGARSATNGLSAGSAISGAPAPIAPVDVALAEAPTAEQPMISSSSPDAQAAYEAERQRLEGEIARQQQIITQLEPVQMALGAATPAGVTQSIEQAREAKSKAEADLAALQPPRPAADPAEIARLEGEIARQQQIITQLEPVQMALGAATPAGVAQSIEQAREAKSKAEAELAALTGGATSAPPVEPAAPVNVAPPVSVAPPAEPTAPVSVAPPAEPTAPPPPPIPAVAAPAPRLVMDEGKDLPLPTDKYEIIVGREDPISGIFPEIDLTPYGGETGGVSRQHARLNHSNGDWSVTDLNSTNYTRVDGAKLEPNVAMPLKDGARLQFGRVAMTFRI
jgi:hypothetical protein